jgi:anion-transporting  ArsA/GET3 family ATPase
MLLDALLARRVVVLSGKGGVGKSIVGAALALAASRRGKKVLLAEVESPLEASRFFGRPPVGPREKEIHPDLWAVNLDSKAVMEEYVRQHVPLDYLARKLVESPVYQRFYEFAPGLPELMVLGKVMVLEEARQRHKPLYDLIVLDAPATGHGLAFLGVPRAASEAIPVGPVGNNARRVESLLRDEEKTTLLVVAIPEEMAVVEALEFHKLARDKIGIDVSAVVLNACHERRFTPAQESEILRLGAEGATGRLAPGIPFERALDASRRHVRRRELTSFYVNRLKKALPDDPLVTLPSLFKDSLGLAEVRLMAERLEAA